MKHEQIDPRFFSRLYLKGSRAKRKALRASYTTRSADARTRMATYDHLKSVESDAHYRGFRREREHLNGAAS